MDTKNKIINFNQKTKELKNTQKHCQDNNSEKKETSKQNKLLTFPKAPAVSIQKALQADQKFKSILGGRVISTLLGLFILTVMTQSFWISKSENNNLRSLASNISRSLANVETYLSQNQRNISSIATRPKALDHFNFAVLHGHYQLQTKGQWISSLSANKNFIKIGSTSRFLKKYKHLWKIKFVSLQLSYSDDKKKIYKLFNKQKKVVGKAFFQLDGQGHLQSLSFSKKQL